MTAAWYVILIFEDKEPERINLEARPFDEAIREVKDLWEQSPCVGFTLMAQGSALNAIRSNYDL